MNELELSIRAKSYIDMLANGIDPISGSELPEASALNQVRLSRCFFFVSDLLKQIIENDGKVGRKKDQERAAFSMTARQLELFTYSKRPIPSTHLMGKLNRLINIETTQKLPVSAVTGWLVSKGYLKHEDEPAGKKRRLPTEKGGLIGISLEERQGERGSFIMVVYNETAQHFIVDHLKEIILWHYGQVMLAAGEML